MLQNSEKFRGNPEFQEDMLATVRESVDKLNQLMVRIHEGGREASAVKPVELANLLRGVVGQKNGVRVSISLEPEVEEVVVIADENRLSAVLSHLVNNALEAIDEDGAIKIVLRRLGGEAVIEIEDDGVGMTPDFIRDDNKKER